MSSCSVNDNTEYTDQMTQLREFCLVFPHMIPLNLRVCCTNDSVKFCVYPYNQRMKGWFETYCTLHVYIAMENVCKYNKAGKMTPKSLSKHLEIIRDRYLYHYAVYIYVYHLISDPKLPLDDTDSIVEKSVCLPLQNIILKNKRLRKKFPVGANNIPLVILEIL